MDAFIMQTALKRGIKETSSLYTNTKLLPSVGMNLDFAHILVVIQPRWSYIISLALISWETVIRKWL